MSLLEPLKRIIVEYHPLLAMMQVDYNTNQVAKMIFFFSPFMFVSCIRHALCFFKFSWFCGLNYQPLRGKAKEWYKKLNPSLANWP